MIGEANAAGFLFTQTKNLKTLNCAKDLFKYEIFVDNAYCELASNEISIEGIDYSIQQIIFQT